jgi:undecaprenyl-diphosphatase
MDDLFRVVIQGIVEGITEFLPVSSTGHLILCQHWMKVSEDDPFWKMFAVVIQIGAIFAVMVYFRKRILDLFKRSMPLITVSEPSPVMAVVVGTIPALIAGKLIHEWVEKHWEKPVPIALALGIGGVLMILIEMFSRPRTESIEKMTWKQAIGVGIFQILAVLFPGTSRSAATIMGGMTLGMNRSAAAEFSFFLAIPTMLAACGYSALKWLMNEYPKMDHDQLARQCLLLLIGTLVSFIVAWVVIAAFMNYVRKKSFLPFAVYRIILAIIVLLVMRNS